MTVTVRIQKNSLTDLLKKVQRKHSVAGKNNVSQVESCILVYEKDEVSVTSLPKDGVSSVATFAVKVNEVATGTCFFPVPSIDTLLGVLKFHGQSLRLTFNDTKETMLIKSGKKQTTLASSLKAKAYLASRDTILEWYQNSTKLAAKIHPELGTYTAESGESIPCTGLLTLWDVNTTDLFEALRCDGMNGKKTGQYTFKFGDARVSITTGDDMKGRTTTEIAEWLQQGRVEMTFEGGLEETMKLAMGNVDIFFLEFQHRQGQPGHWGMIVKFDNLSFLFQTSVVKA